MSKLSDIVLQIHAVYRVCLITTKMVFKERIGMVNRFFLFIYFSLNEERFFSLAALCMACRILVPQTEPPAVEAQSLNHWATRGVPWSVNFRWDCHFWSWGCCHFKRTVTTISIYTVILCFPGGSDSQESAWNAGDPGLIPELGRSPRDGNGNPLQYSCLENPKDRGAWQSHREIHGGREELDTTERLTFHFHTLPGIVLNALHAFIYLILITTVSVGTILVPVLSIRKLSHHKLKSLIQGFQTVSGTGI